MAKIWYKSIGQLTTPQGPAAAGGRGARKAATKRPNSIAASIVRHRKVGIHCRMWDETGPDGLSLDPIYTSWTDVKKGASTRPSTTRSDVPRYIYNPFAPAPSPLPPDHLSCNSTPILKMTSRQARLLSLPSGLTRTLASKPRVLRLQNRSMANIATFRIPKVSNEPNVRFSPLSALTV